MSITLNLSPERERQLRRVSEETGKPVEQIVADLLETLPDKPKAEEDRTLALLEQWQAEDALMTEEEKLQADRDTEELLRNLRAHPLTIGHKTAEQQTKNGKPHPSMAEMYATWKADFEALTKEEQEEEDRKTDEVMAALRALDRESARLIEEAA